MFKVAYRPKNDRDHSRTKLFNDIKDLGQFILNLTDSEKEANSAMKWCENATFGSKVTRQPNYKIECFNDDALAKDIENKVVKTICDYLRIGYNFIGYDNEALTWDIGAGTSWIKYHEDDGYYIVINRVEPDGTCKELFSTTNKNSQQFITDAVVGTEKAMKKHLKETKNVQARNCKSCVNDKLSPEQICKRLLMVKKMQSSGDTNFKEYHDTVYSDGVWKIDAEVHPYGNIRFWVSREDAYGNYNNSVFTMYRADNGQIRWCADYKIKKDIVNKLLKTYEYMEKAGIATSL